MKKMLFLTFIINKLLLAQPIIDGNATEWTGTAPAVNSFIYGNGTLTGTNNLNEWIWTDADDDQRTDNFGGFVDGAKQDIRELRISSDNNYFYYLLKLEANIDKTPGDGSIQLQISMRRNSSISTQEYLGGFSDSYVPNSSSPGVSVPDGSWDYLIITRGGSSNINNTVYNSAWSRTDVGDYISNTTNGIFEGRIPWNNLGGAPGENTFYFTFSIFRANTSDNTFDTGGDNTKGNCLDFITATTINTYWALIGVSTGGINNYGRLDYAASIDFLNISQPLPAELSSFSAYVVGNNVKLSWVTETEVNNYGFDVERSLTPTSQNEIGAGSSQMEGMFNWEKIAFVEGHGNSNSPKNYSFADEDVVNGKYVYRLKQIDTDGKFEYSKEVEVIVESLPSSFELFQNYPNPFNPSTKLSWQSPVGSWQTLKIYDVLGNVVGTLVDEYKEAGSYEVEFEGKSLASGAYFYELNAEDFTASKKMLILK